MEKINAKELLKVLIRRINIQKVDSKMVVNRGRKRAKKKRKYERRKEREAEEKRPFVSVYVG